MSSKRLIINMVSNIVSFIVSMGISFFLTPYIINTVGKEAYGFVGLANNFVSYAGLITLALNSLAKRFITIKIHQNDFEGANKYFTSVTIANIITSVLMMIPAIIIVSNMNKIINVPFEILNDVQILWALVFLNFLIGLITSTYNVITFATNRLDLSAIRSIQSNILKVIILVALFSIFTPNVWYLGLAALICNLFIFRTNINYKRKLLPQLSIKLIYFDAKVIQELLLSGIWSVITKLGQILSDGLDLLITNIFINASAMGTLSVAKTLPSAISSLLVTTSGIFLPQLTIYYAKGEIDKLVEELKKSMKISGLFTIIIMSAMVVLGYSFYSLWVPGQDIILIQTLSVITILTVIVSGVVSTLFGVYTIVNKLKVNSYVILFQGILNAAIVFLLLKTTNLGIIAVAGVSSITATIRNLTFVPIYTSKCLGVSKKTFYPTIIRYIISSIITIIGDFIISYNIDKSTWFGLICSGIVCVVFASILNYFLFLNKKERKFIIKKLVTIIK
ncbi:MAG: MATE family efflux transporter [Romboutsia timonensis]|uniref:lipopolysaccharide biosynthesis protein n=1 Tax=Romboutsia timonensis TaxID=1776391 RepID=UPI002A74BBAB|nr:MATE family efflux transporter [Romboutsia timonensis]MDY3001341.1 MATE family efflux transporter [Romboutsia timonensis]